MIESMVEQIVPEIDSDESNQEDNEVVNDEGEVAYIVHALAGYSNPQTTKVNGLLKC
jgi:Mg2+/Co2+ transporter CorC